MKELPELPLESLRRLARGLIYDSARAEDVVQEAWLAAMRRSPEPEGLRAWLAEAVRRIARSSGRDELRRAAREERAARPEAQPSAAEASARIEILRSLLDDVDALDEPYRTAIVLRFFDELPPRAIAKKLGLPVNTIRTHVRRGLERLRIKLDGERGRDRQEFLAALVPFAGSAPWSLALGAPSLSTPQTIGVIALKHKPLAAALALALLGASWAVLRTLATGESRQEEALAVLAAPDGDHATSPTAPVSTEPAPATAVQREPSPGAPAQSAGTWVVRGHATRGAREPFPDLPLVGRVHAGPKRAGEPLLEQRFRADSRGNFAWTLEPPSTTVTVTVEPALADHLTFETYDVYCPGDPPPEKLHVSAYPLDIRVHGTVRDPEQRPVAGARALYRTYQGVHETLTGEDGTFTVPTSSYLLEDNLRVVAAGFAQARVSLGVLRPGEASIPDVVLEPELRVRGRVLDEDGAPLSGARVGFLYPHDHVSTTTDERGSFEIGTLPPRGTDRRVSASMEGYVQASVRLEEGQEEVELRLERGARLTGRVRTESGASVAGAWLSVGDTPWPEPRVETWSDAEGRFTLEHVASGEQHVWVWRTGLAEVRHDLVVSRSGETLDGIEIVLPDDHFLSGIVLGDKGEPLPWAMVTADDPDESRYPPRIIGFQTYTGDDGRFVMDGLPEMEVQIGVLASGYARLEQRFDGLDRDDVVLRPVPAAGLAGRVVDAGTGAPIRSFVLRFVWTGAIPEAERLETYRAELSRGVTIESDEGVWSLREDWKPGQATAVEVRTEGYAPAFAPRVETSVDPDPDACVLRLVRGTLVGGRVVEKESGKPIAGARVRRFTPTEPLDSRRRDEFFLEAETDSAGRFELSNVPTGEMSLAIEVPARSLVVDGPFTVNGAAPVERWIELGSGARIRGRLLDADGHGLAGEVISAYGLEVPGDRHEWKATTSDDGSFDLEGLPAGLFHVRWELGVPPTRMPMPGGRGYIESRAYDLLQLVTLAPNEDRVLDLQPKGKTTVRGTITFDGELPAVQAVMLMPRGETSKWAKGGRAVLAENGCFEARNVEAGTYTVMARIQLPDSTLAMASTTTEVPEEGLVEVELVLERQN